jgi:serine/threonine-protein kinase
MAVGVHSVEPIANYRVDSPLPRQPGEGVAYDAVDGEGRRVDLLVLPRRDRDFASRFLETASALKELRHQHLPAVLGFGAVREGLYLATERLRGQTLKELIGESGGLSPMRVLRLLGEAADALDAAHSAGVLHRALSPASVVVEEIPHERALLTGFALGLAADESHPTWDGAAYASPEEARGQPARDSSDVYALACIMFECLTGTPPFRRETPADVLAGHAGEPPPVASALRPGLPRTLDETLARGLSKRPTDRPGTAAQLVSEAARAVLDVEPTAAPAPPSAVRGEPKAATQTGAPAAPVPRRSVRSLLPAATVPAALAALAIGAAAVGGWLAGNPGSEPEAPVVLTSGDVELTVPASWQEAEPARRLGALRLDAAIAARHRGGRIDAGRVPGTLPGRVASRIGTRAGRPEPVRLGELQADAWRTRRATLFAAGTDSGVVVVACRGPASARAGCERVAGSLAVPAAAASLAALNRWTARLDRTMRRLDRRRRAGRSRLRAARTPHGQAVAARGLRKAYSRAARTLSGRGAPTGADRAQRSLVESMEDVAASYGDLARATRGRSGRAYGAARRSIRTREGSLQRTLRRL